jgi:hypothetical protein
VWTGNEWVDIGKKIFDTGYQANAYLGNVTVTTGGDVSINVTENLTGYGIEKWYS